MEQQDVGLLFICFDILRTLHETRVPTEYCSDSRQLETLIENNRQHRIILVCKAKDVRRLYDIITKRNIRETYILGRCTEPEVTNNEITTIFMNEQGLQFHILTETIWYTRCEELIQQQLGNNSLANARVMNIHELLDLIETLINLDIE